MMKKIVAVVCTFALAGGILAGCSSTSSDTKTETKSDTATEQKAETTEVKAPESDVAMSYITPADAEKNLDSSEYVFVDLRKADDYKAGHIKGAISADMDAAKGGDFQNGVDTMKAALKEATGSETGADKKLVLICYSGKSYAQAGTNVLSAIGANMDNVFTLEGGMKAWTGATEA